MFSFKETEMKQIFLERIFPFFFFNHFVYAKQFAKFNRIHKCFGSAWNHFLVNRHFDGRGMLGSTLTLVLDRPSVFVSKTKTCRVLKKHLPGSHARMLLAKFWKDVGFIMYQSRPENKKTVNWEFSCRHNVNKVWSLFHQLCLLPSFLSVFWLQFSKFLIQK